MLTVLVEKGRKALSQLPNLGRAVRLVFGVAPHLAFVWVALLVVQGLLPAAIVYVTKSLVDSMVHAAGAGQSWEALRAPLMQALLMAGLLLATEVLQAISRWVRTAQAELVRDHVAALMHEKASQVDLAFYESPEYFDLLHRVRWDIAHRPMALLEHGGTIAQGLLTLAAMLAILTRFGPIVPAALALSTIPALFVVIRYAIREYEWKQRVTTDERRAFYYEWVVTSLENAAEVRLFGLGPHFRSLFTSLRKRLRSERLKLVRDQGVAGIAGATLGLAITGAALAWVVWKAVAGAVTLGEVAMFYQAFNQGQRLMKSLLESAGQIYSNSLFLGNLFEFLDLQPKVLDPVTSVPAPAALSSEIRFENVTFRYPGTERPALSEFALRIPAGKLVAIVGANGAGKSTLIKLLCRFYDPDVGRIVLDGHDLREYAAGELRDNIAVLFQEPAHYNTSLSGNIAMGSLARQDSPDAVRHAARSAGADEVAAKLPEGYETLLGKWFVGGTELSVGEWQRVSLGRAFFRNASIVLLDEPTSAMDSWAENEWMDRFRTLVQGKTALIITHRFTTAMRADVIHVMKEGRIVESGSHEELVRLGGLYASSWRAQVSHEHVPRT
jgi:ATP-binding cassette subfamily B protein